MTLSSDLFGIEQQLTRLQAQMKGNLNALRSVATNCPAVGNELVNAFVTHCSMSAELSRLKVTLAAARMTGALAQRGMAAHEMELHPARYHDRQMDAANDHNDDDDGDPVQRRSGDQGAAHELSRIAGGGA